MGNSRRQAFPAIVLGHSLIGIIVVLNGAVGARLRISFPGKRPF